jgi:hypothetical protein
LNLREEILQIMQRAAAIAELRAEIGPRPRTNAAATAAWDLSAQRLNRAAHALVYRIAQLHAYRAKLDDLQLQRDALAALGATKGIEGWLAGLEADAALDTEQAEYTQFLTDEVERMEHLVATIVMALPKTSPRSKSTPEPL